MTNPPAAHMPSARDQAWESRGFASASSVLDAGLVAHLRLRFDQERDGRGGGRCSLDSPLIVTLGRQPDLGHFVDRLLGEARALVGATLFDKPPGSNWPVAWHQDRVVPLAQRTEEAGYRCWTTKQGIPHAEPPVRVLEGLLALRVHLDPTGPASGGLRVLPGTHSNGLLDAEQIAAAASSLEATTGTGPAGGAFAFRPLLLHSSQRSQVPHRRVVHLLFAPASQLREVPWRRFPSA